MLFPSGITGSRWVCSSVQLGFGMFWFISSAVHSQKKCNPDFKKFSFLILQFYLEAFFSRVRLPFEEMISYAGKVYIGSGNRVLPLSILWS